MRTLLALFVASCNALILQPHRTRTTQLRSDPRDEAIEVEAYVEDLIDDVVRDVKKAKEEEKSYKEKDTDY